MVEVERRTLLVEVWTPKGRWSAKAVEELLAGALPGLEPKVYGAISGPEVDAAYRKLCQLSRETESDASKADRVHSAHKAQSFFQDMLPTAWWRAKQIGGRRAGASR